MITYTRSKYNVFKDGELFLENLRPIEIEAKIGIMQEIVSQYAKKKSKWKGKDGYYTFVVSETSEYEVKAKPNIKVKEIDTAMPDEWVQGWNDVHKAALLLKTGRGKIEQRFINGRLQKVTVRK